MLIITIIAVVFIILDQLSKVWISGAFDGVPVADPVADGIPVISEKRGRGLRNNAGSTLDIRSAYDNSMCVVHMVADSS